jgi:hypothetical protein
VTCNGVNGSNVVNAPFYLQTDTVPALKSMISVSGEGDVEGAKCVFTKVKGAIGFDNDDDDAGRMEIGSSDATEYNAFDTKCRFWCI